MPDPTRDATAPRDDSAPRDDDPAPRDRAELEPWFVDRYAQYWSSQGLSVIEGRMVGHLLLSDQPVSADELAKASGASRGSVSTYTRRLVEIGFVRRVRRPGDRSHYFVMDADVWGGFLDNEHAYLVKQRELASTALELMPPSGPAHERIRNMHGYMEWLLGYYGTLRSEWARHKEGLAGADENPPRP
ncbi:MarR family transcriptional regulator [Sanguibacter sp. 4.1]|uniref:MarR family transcriptional regulator n=1 Tax=Sanguibacter biliveldensis TaxID=3030830 RepID=A0AAF0ZA89_9MICO|nr:MarR family transcriptional regulator [Sanguibacter sp. 4.1]WPF83932.1 MarR family transcriptional regulator [Sanguibacter sp. 4.1]